jgi:hypothetical protein
MNEYPKWRYHNTEKAKIVSDPEHEENAASDENGWVDHPSALVVPDEPELTAEKFAADRKKRR